MAINSSKQEVFKNQNGSLYFLETDIIKWGHSLLHNINYEQLSNSVFLYLYLIGVRMSINFTFNIFRESK